MSTKTPEQRRAYALVREQLHRGELKAPARCPRCKQPRKVVATFPKGYAVPLHVVWRCHHCAWSVLQGAKTLIERTSYRPPPAPTPRTGYNRVSYREPGRRAGSRKREG
jgi:hypothetical protein